MTPLLPSTTTGARAAARRRRLAVAGLAAAAALGLAAAAAGPADAQPAPAATTAPANQPPGTSPAPEPSAAAPTPGVAVPGTGLTVTSTIAGSNDYLFRGISQTRNNWAIQGTFDVAHESGFYIGAFITNAKFLAAPYNDTRRELDLLAGYRFTLAGISFDVGYIAYLYPGQTKPTGTQLNEYQEIVLKASYTLDILKLSAAFAYSPNFFGRSGDGFYVEGGADLTLPAGFTLFGRLGHQWIERNPRFGTPDYLWLAVGVQREIYWGVTATVGVYGTNIRRRECVPVPDRADFGQRICDTRVLFTLSRTF